MKRPIKFMIGVLIAVSVSAVALFGGCTINVGESRDGKDGTDLNWQEIYEKVNEENGGNLTFGDFVKEYMGLKEQTAQQAAIENSMLSGVSIFSTFTYGKISTYTQVYCGSGVIVDLDKENGNATVITNSHVIYDSSANNKFCTDVRLFLYGQDTEGINFNVSSWYTNYTDATGSRVVASELTDDSLYRIEPEVVGASLTYDIAVLKVENSDVIKHSSAVAATFAKDEDYPKAGNGCYAVGNPSGYGTSVTKGIISVDSEIIPLDIDEDGTASSYRVMRTDTAINGGNSGGGLYNEYGDLIGIVNAKTVEAGTDNMGYALPYTTVKRVMQSLIANADVTTAKTGYGLYRAQLGINVSYRTGVDSAAVKYENIYVSNFVSGSLWSNLLKKDDRIERIEVGSATSKLSDIYETALDSFTARDGADVSRKFMVDDVLLGVRVGDTVKLTVSRDGVTYYAYVTYASQNNFVKSV